MLKIFLIRLPRFIQTVSSGFFLLATVLVFSWLPCPAQVALPVLIPKPVETRQLPGTFQVSLKAGIHFADPSWETWIQWLNLAHPLTGKAWHVAPEAEAWIQCRLVRDKKGWPGPEAYRLLLEGDRVRIEALSSQGIGNGLKTLVQCFESAQKQPVPILPCLEIFDYPRFGWRGVMLDVSRHFFTVPEIKAYLLEMSRAKFNIFHWHLTDDQGWRVEIKSWPRLTSVGAWRVPRSGAFGSSERKPPQPGEAATYGGFYSQDQIREVVSFASQLGIQIVPEIDVPGHCMAVLAAYPEFGCTKDTNIRVNPGSKFSDWYGNSTFKMLVENSLNPSDEKVYTFLDQVFGELAKLFPGPYIHVGGDECYYGYWKKDPGCKALMEKLGIRHAEDLQGYFMNRVKKSIQAHGKKVIGWDEVMEGGMSNEAILMFWRGWMQKDLLPQVKKGGYKVIMSPTSTNYFDYFQGEKTIEPPVYEGLRLKDAWKFEPVPEGWEPSMVLGGQSNLWTEKVPTLKHAEYMTWPRAWATAEKVWVPKGAGDDWNDFIGRVLVHMERSAGRGIKVSQAVFDPVVTYKKENGQLFVELSTEVPGLDLYYDLEESMPDLHSTRYTAPIRIPAEGAQTLRIQAYRNGKPIGHLITLGSELLKGKAK